ncbi:MAG: 30S ribosomal protein S15 [Candidatus Cloacimonetes bacterium]|nr:30S ribosomal protein S15 [Candidatus Cloacimonadota bacterium]
MTTAMEEKAQVISAYRTHEKDTGSAEVQIALLTHKIKALTEHFKTHKKDHHSRRGLLTMVGKRRSLLRYLKGINPQGHADLLKKLELRK